MMQSRPVVSLSSWMAEAARLCAETGKGLEVVTPTHSRLTLPLRPALTGQDCRWVVTDLAGCYYDGFSGARLAWDGGAFLPDGGRPGREAVHRQRDRSAHRVRHVDRRGRRTGDVSGVGRGSAGRVGHVRVRGKPLGRGAAGRAVP